MYEQFYK